jgi:hypothetical protein
MKKFIILMLFSSVAVAQSALDIMKKVDVRDDGDSVSAIMQMVLIDKQGKKRVRKMRTFSQDIDADTEHKSVFFLSPSDVKNTAFLTFDYDNQDDDQWMYLPALKKTKRIPASDKDSAFMGSDFSYADMTKVDIDDYNYKIIKQTSIKRPSGKVPVWVISSIPKSKKTIDETGYTKTTLYVRQDNYMVTRAKFYLKKSSRVKYMDIKKLEKINNIWMAMQTTMTTKQGKQMLHKTITSNTDVRVNEPIEQDVFSIRAIEKGL